MVRVGLWGTGSVALGLLVGASIVGATPLAAVARTQTAYKIAVDNPNAVGVEGHDFEYVDYFPRSGLKVHSSDVLDFNWNTGAIDGAHTVSFLPAGTSLPPLAVPEGVGDEPGLQFNPAILFPSDPTCGNSKANPCAFDGTKVVSSGFIPNAAGGDFFVKLDPKLLNGGKSAVVNYVCEIHANMAGSITLVSDKRDASELGDVQDRAEEQFERDTRDALNVEKRDNHATVALNPDGKTHTITAIAGTATPFVEIVEMLPGSLKIKPGDTVNWVTKTIQDPHTVTFPKGPGSDSVDPLLPVCEATPKDIPLPTVNPFLCGNPGLFELHFVPQPQGASSIATPTTVGSSGIIANGPGAPNHFAFTFPNVGTFEFQCRIHDHMVGKIIAAQ